MRRTAFVITLCMLLTAGSAPAADDLVSSAMKLYEKRHYAEAAAMLRSELPSVEPAKRGGAHLTLGMVYLKDAELHRGLYLTSVASSVDYLKKLAARSGGNRSRFVDLYLGEALLEAGNHGQAAAPLEQFMAREGVEPKYQALARIFLGLSRHLGNQKQKAEELWAGVDTAEPEVKSALAAVYSKAGLRDKNPAGMIEESIAAAKTAGKVLPLGIVADALGVYTREGFTEKGLNLLKRADLKAVSYRESRGRSKVMNFYEPSLLGSLAELFLQASIAALEKAATDPKLKDTANYYLGDAYAQAGNVQQSAKVTAAFISSAQMPQSYKDRATARQAANQHQRGRQFEAIGVWDELSRKQPQDPDLLAEVLFACGRLKTDCPKVAQRAVAAVETGEGKRFFNLNIALGRYYFGKRDYKSAAIYMEAGRDKGNKNKIEYNDTVMLVDLAETYYRTKKFSEALEIFFEMGKQFPEVRQIQEALQGVYSMEHKSAGDVKIF